MKNFKAEKSIRAFNVVKVHFNDKSFNRDTLKMLLKMCCIPYNNLFITELSKSPILTEVEKDIFEFDSNEPVYYKILDRVYANYLKREHQYRKTYNAKKKLLLENLC